MCIEIPLGPTPHVVKQYSFSTILDRWVLKYEQSRPELLYLFYSEV